MATRGRKSQAQIEFSVLNKGFNDELQSMTGEVKKMNKEFEIQKEKMSLTATESEKLGAKLENLKDQLMVAEEYTKTANDAYDEASRLLGENSAEAQKWADTMRTAQLKQAKLETQVTKTTGELKQMNAEIDQVDGGKDVDNLRKDIDELKESADGTNGAIGQWGDSFKALLGAGAIGGVIAGVSEIAGAVSGLLNDALEESKNKAIIKFSMNVDNETVAAVQDAMWQIETYGIDSQEALQGVRKQFLLNKDASDEANQEIVKMAGYLATAYAGLDFNEIIQESNEIAKQFEMGQDEALAMVDALLKVGFPEDQLDIISEYGNQLKMAGYEAKDIQAIFKAGVETGTWNIDNLLDGVKEGRIKLTEFATEIPDAVKPAVKAIGMTEEEFQGLADQIAKGGKGGKKAYEEIAKAVLDVDNKTEQAAAGTAIWGTLWEEQGEKIADTIVNASEEIITATGNMDALNRAIAGMDEEPAVRYAKAMSDLDGKLIPVKTALAEVVSDGLDVVNAALEGTSINGKNLENVIAMMTKTGVSDLSNFGHAMTVFADGSIQVRDITGTYFRDLTEEEKAAWGASRKNVQTNAQAINEMVKEKFSKVSSDVTGANSEVETSTAKTYAAMEEAIRSYAKTNGEELEESRKNVESLANYYGFSEEQVITVLNNWGGTVEEFQKAHDKALGKAEQAVDSYTDTATDGFSKLTQNETISWKEYLKNMEANRKAQANWWKNLKILNNAGIDDAIIEELQAMGPAGAEQLQRFVDELYTGSSKQGTAYDDMDKKTKGKVDKINETRRKGFDQGARIADESINKADWPGKGERMIEETAEGMVNTIPELNKAAEKTGKDGGNSVAKGLSASEVKTNVKEAAARTGQYIEDKIGISLDAIKRDAKNLDWTISRPTIPKFTMNGDFNTRTGEVPKIQYSWYAKGGYMDSTTLIGMGEAGAEGIVPLQGKHMMPFADAVAERISNTTNSTQIIINASLAGPQDYDELGRTIDRHLNQQSHEVKIVKGR